jgi:hypothetical protein
VKTRDELLDEVFAGRASGATAIDLDADRFVAAMRAFAGRPPTPLIMHASRFEELQTLLADPTSARGTA